MKRRPNPWIVIPSLGLGLLAGLTGRVLDTVADAISIRDHQVWLLHSHDGDKRTLFPWVVFHAGVLPLIGCLGGPGAPHNHAPRLDTSPTAIIRGLFS